MSNVYETHKPAVAGGGLYLKLEDGQTVKLRLASEPYIYQNEYKGQYSTRYAWVIYNHDEEIAQTLSLPATVYRSIASFATDPDYGDPSQYNLKLTRHGTGTDTTYQVVPSPKKEALTAEQQTKVDKIKITEVKGLEHALPLAQVSDAKDAPLPSGASPDEQPPVESRVAEVFGGDDIPF